MLLPSYRPWLRKCLCAACVGVVWVWGNAAWAVSVSTHTFAMDHSDLSMPECSVVVDRFENKSDATSVTSSIRSDATKSHAQAWATATVTGMGLMKSASGIGWVDPGIPTYDAKAFSWSAAASGTQLIVNGSAPTANLQFVIPPAGAINLAATGYPPSFSDPRYAPPTLQTFARDALPMNLDPTQDLSSLRATFAVRAMVHQNGNLVSSFLDGGFTITPQGDQSVFGPQPPQVQFQAPGSAGAMAQFVPTQSPPITIQTGVPFTVTFDVAVQMGNGTAGAPVTYTTPLVDPVGSSSSLTMFFNLMNPGSFTMSPVAVPVAAGDFTRDGAADVSDIPWMTGALVDAKAYESGNTLTSANVNTIGDFNNDNQVTNADLQAYLNVLLSGGTTGVSRWLNTAGGNWSVASNWTTVPNAVGLTADFSTLDITANTTVTLNGNFTAGQLRFGDTNPSHNWTLTGASPSSTLTLSVGGGSPVINVVNQMATISANVAGNQGLIKTGPGTLTLTNNNLYTGPTLVEAGTLRVNGTHGGGGYMVNSGGTLGGSGNINAQVAINSGGSIAPGNSIGTLTVGSLALNGTMVIELDQSDPNIIDVLNITNSLGLFSATLDFNVTGALSQPAYVFAHYGTLSGSPFVSILDIPAGYTIDYNYLGLKQIALVGAVVPEPTGILLATIGALGVALSRRKKGRSPIIR